jgi:hypothetical protein
MVSVPQQPTNELMFYYVHSLMAVTKVLLCLSAPDPALQNLTVIENIAVDNLMYLC